MPIQHNAATATIGRPRVEAKFLYLGSEKFYVKGATYGAFAPNSNGDQFPESLSRAKDFALMREAGINAILTYTVPPVAMLDQASEHGIRVIVNIPWMAYECFLEEARFRRRVIREVREAVTSCQRHPGVLMYCVAKEIPPQIVRWHGPKKVQAFLKDLCDVAKDIDPDGLVTYTNFPTTEYLELPFVDVSTFNVYLHQRRDFCKYLSRLQHLAGEHPLVLTEFGQCSFRHGRAGQAEFLDWQIEEIFDHGLAGAVVFGWTDPFFQDGLLIDDWGFGLVDAERRPKPSYEIVRRRFTSGVPFSPNRRWPRISVVVALYNAARTLHDCLESLRHLNYPDYEVIVVNDGSTDASAEIMAQFPYRTVTTKNRGISAARNEGLRMATGEIVAYIDSDANADPDWLSHLSATYMESDVAGVGGPNIVPLDDNWKAQCVYRAPGGPTQVMLDDQLAEHIPGCNMSFRKAALDEISGFDPIFTKAADDVDICWRLLDRGYHLGFSPSAVVWHRRRPSVKAYWRQQVGYGESEALLEQKFPNKFNPWGHTVWGGRIYAPYPFLRLFSRPVIYQGLWGSAPFQPMYDQGGGGVLTFLPRAMEWHFGLIALAVLGAFQPWALLAVMIGVAYTTFYCAACAWSADVGNLIRTAGPPTALRRLRWRALLALLNFLEPIARDWGRLKGGLTPWRSAILKTGNRVRLSGWMQVQPFRRQVKWAHRGGPSLDKYPFLDLLSGRLTSQGCAVGWNPASKDWDLRIRRGVLGEVLFRMVVEHHGGAKRQARYSATIRSPNSVRWVMTILAAVAVATAATGFDVSLAIALGGLLLMWVAPILEANRLESAVHSATEEVAAEIGRPTRAATTEGAAEHELSPAAVTEEDAPDLEPAANFVFDDAADVEYESV